MHPPPLTLLVCLLAGAALTGTELRVGGSTTHLYGYAKRAEATIEQALGLDLRLSGGGSSTGIARLLQGDLDLALSSRELKPEEATAGAVATVIAHDAICVFVHPSLAIENLSLDQLRAVFAGEVANWSQVGGPDRPIVLVLPDPTSGTRTTFAELVLDGVRFGPRAIEAPSAHHAVEKWQRIDAAVGFAGLGEIVPGMKPLAIDGVVASPPTVRDGSYPLARKLLVVTRGEPSDDAGRVVGWLLGPDGQAAIGRAFVTLE